jgi:CheY-like chemotaxis protein
MVGGLTENGGTETILVVDDERMLREMLSGFLSDNGYTVMLAEDGQEAIEMYASNNDTISLIVMDIVMPRKDGISAYNEIKSRYPAAKILLMSGYNANKLHVPESMEIILKPFSFLGIVKTIRNTINA